MHNTMHKIGGNMNSKEYLEKVEHLLKGEKLSDKDDMLSDLRDYFENGINEGRSEEELISEIGSPEHFIEVVGNNSNSERNDDVSQITITKTGIFNKLNDFPNELKEVRIETDMADVFFISSERNMFEITGKELENSEFEYRTSDNILYISLKKKKKSIIDMIFSGKLSDDLNWKINVYYNTERFRNIHIKSVSGDISGEKIISDALKISTVSGDFKSKSLDSYISDFKSVSGDIKCTEIISPKLNFDSVSGDIKAEYLKVEKIRFKTVSGDISVSEAGKSVEGTTVSGDVSIKCIDIPELIKLKSVSGDIKIKADKISGFDYEIKTLSGDITDNLGLKIDKRKSSGTYKTASGHEIILSTVSGDISITEAGE